MLRIEGKPVVHMDQDEAEDLAEELDTLRHPSLARLLDEAKAEAMATGKPQTITLVVDQLLLRGGPQRVTSPVPPTDVQCYLCSKTITHDGKVWVDSTGGDACPGRNAIGQDDALGHAPTDDVPF